MPVAFNPPASSLPPHPEPMRAREPGERNWCYAGVSVSAASVTAITSVAMVGSVLRCTIYADSRAGNAVARDRSAVLGAGGCRRRGASGGYGLVTMGIGVALTQADERMALFARIRR